MTVKIKIGISACLVGRAVRYDGGHKLDRLLLDSLGSVAEWVPICPEVEAGFSVPREPMQLVGEAAAPRLIARETGRDRTETFAAWVRKKLAHVELLGVRGFVLKARSPSCGVHDAELFALSGAFLGRRPGLFAEELIRLFSTMPVEDEERLRDPAVRQRFLARL